MFVWDDLRYFLALAQEGTLAGAAERLRADPTTVSRRLTALESAVGNTLMVRSRDGWRLTGAGQRILTKAEVAAEAMADVGRKIREAEENIIGRVRLTTMEVLASRSVAPLLPKLHQRYPHIRVEIKCTPVILDLERGDADLALRIVRPTEGNLVARKLFSVTERPYVSVAYCEAHNIHPAEIQSLAGHNILITYGHVSWLDGNSRYRVVLKSTSGSSLYAACAAGLGITMIPDLIAATDSRLLALDHLNMVQSTPVWMAMHQDVAKVKSVRAVADFLVEHLGASE